MSEDQQEYATDALAMLGAGYGEQPAAIIDNPRTVKALRDTGLFEYKAWGWVKLSAKFIAHLHHLKGAKLAIWQCIALSIDETGTCKMTYKDIGTLTGYSHTEVIESIKELEAAGYLTVNKDGKTNIYEPVFVARGENKPQETLVKKLDSTPVYQYESSPALENSAPSIKRVKRVNTPSTIKGIQAAMYADRPVTVDDLPLMELALTEFHAALSLPHNWNWYPAKTSDESAWRELREFVFAEWQKDERTFRKYATWRATPYVKGALSNLAIQRRPTEFITSWSDYLASSSMYSSNDQGFML